MANANSADNPFVNIKVIRFRELLLDWGKKNIRSYPWRYQTDPYRVLISEFMLHRTQTKQVIPIYEHFVNSFSTFEEYLTADEDIVREILQPLGLNWRIEGMLRALRKIEEEYETIPNEFEKLKSIPGIGQYIAGATICFTQNIPITIIDSNIVRVTGRVFGLDLTGEARRKKPVIDAIALTCDPEHPRDFYYSMIDLAHKLCHPEKPDCAHCPLLVVPCLHSIWLLENKGVSK